MTIAVLGPGAMGTLFGAFLSRAGHRVWLIDHSPARAHQLTKQGLTVIEPEGEWKAPALGTAHPGQIGQADLLLIFVKSHQTAVAALPAKPCIGPKTLVLTLQNGLGNLEVLSEVFGAGLVAGGITGHGATWLAPGQVRHAGRGVTVIGEQSGPASSRLTALRAFFQSAGIETDLTDHLASALWGKLVLNAAVNPVGALTGLPNGRLIQPPLAGLTVQVAREAASVAEGLEIPLPYPDPADKLREVCSATAENINSMLQDVRRRCRTEVEAINGAVVRSAAKAGLSAPLNAALRDLVLGVETGWAS